MRKIASLFVALLLLAGCSSVPLTGRKQVLLVSDQEVLSSSLTQYNDYIKTAKKSTNVNKSAMVTRVGKRIAAATEDYLRANGMADEVKNFSWEFNLVNDPQVNAFCMPGGKIVVYERNDVTNKVLEEKGIKLVVIPSAELSRGRGGPRCMSMPIWRED